MGVYTGSGPTDPTVGSKGSVTAFGVPAADAIQALASAWTAYTPTISGFTQGNGTVDGEYTQVGKMFFFRASLTFGSTTTIASGPCTFTVPTAAIAAYATGNGGWGLQAWLTDTGTATYSAHPRWESTSTVSAFVLGTNGVRASITTTVPFTWATGDVIGISGVYEGA